MSSQASLGSFLKKSYNRGQTKKPQVILDNRGLIIKRSDISKIFTQKQYFKILSDMTLHYKKKIGMPLTARCYISNNKEVIMPRTMVSYLIKHKLICSENIQNNLSFGQPLKSRYDEFSENLFPNQTLICEWLIENIFTESRRKIGLAGCVLAMQAGLGKTFVAGGIIAALKRRTLYIVPRKHLKEQAREDLNFNQEDVQYIVVNSILKKNIEFFQQFGLIIFDEIPMYCSVVFRKIFFMVQTSYVLGMTATPDNRADNFDTIYKMAVGRVVDAETIPNYEKNSDNFTGRVNVINYDGPPEYTKMTISPATGRPIAQNMINNISKDPARNELIVGLVKQLWKKKYCTYIFVENRQHVTKLKELITADGEIKKDDVGKLMGGSDTSDDIYEKCPIIIVTYSYGGTGISYIRMNAAIFGTPRRSNYKQICRRITRKGSNEDIERIYIDIVDTSTFLRNQFNTRKNVYNYFGYNIIYDGPLFQRGQARNTSLRSTFPKAGPLFNDK